MSVGPNSRTSENIRNRDLTESTWIPLTLQTSQTVISSAIKPNLFKRRREGNNPRCEARFTAFHLRHTSKAKSEGVTYMATLTHRASATTFCCKKITPLVKKYIQKSGPPLVVQENLHGVGGQGNTPPSSTCHGRHLTSTSPCLSSPGSEGRNASSPTWSASSVGEKPSPVFNSKASTARPWARSQLRGDAWVIQIIAALFCLSSTPCFPKYVVSTVCSVMPFTNSSVESKAREVPQLLMLPIASPERVPLPPKENPHKNQNKKTPRNQVREALFYLLQMKNNRPYLFQL